MKQTDYQYNKEKVVSFRRLHLKRGKRFPKTRKDTDNQKIVGAFFLHKKEVKDLEKCEQNVLYLQKKMR